MLIVAALLTAGLSAWGKVVWLIAAANSQKVQVAEQVISSLLRTLCTNSFPTGRKITRSTAPPQNLYNPRTWKVQLLIPMSW
jgi:hypothetical protein